MKTKIITCMVAVAALSVFGASGEKGSCIKKAISLKSSQAATLVNEYDSEEKEFYDSGAAYYSMTLKRGVAYTVWITGGDAANIDLDVTTNDEYYEDRDDEPSASFDVDEIDGGDTKVAYLYADDWDLDEEGDPKSGKYVVVLTGDIGDSTTLGFTSGIRTFSVVGSESSPKALTMTTKQKPYSGKLVDGEFHFRASLKAGSKYRVRTLGGTEANPLSLSVDGVAEDADPNDSEDTARRVNAYNDARVLVPDTSGKYEFVVSGDGKQSFTFQYEMVPSRKITAHPSIPLLEENNYSTTFVPGRIASTHNYYDSIVDEHLCKIYLNKGERWVFETTGATTNIEMMVYNPSGKVLASNGTSDGVEMDTRAVISASVAGVHYVGAYNPLLDVPDVPTGEPVVLSARNTSTFTEADPFDPTDDVYATANLVVPYPATTNDTPVAYTTERTDAQTVGAIHGPHRFNAADFYDVFAFPCRKGYTYKLRASFADTNVVSQLNLDAKLFYIRNGKEVNVSYGDTTIDPSFGNVTAGDDLTFKAVTNAVHYLRVWVANGKGLDFPDYRLHAICANGTNELGLVKVVSKGAPGTWSLNAEKFAYLSDTTLAVAPSAALTIKGNAITGFTSPAATTVSVPAWTEGSDVVVVTNVYSDIYDSKYVKSYTTKTVTKNGKKTTTKVANYSTEGGDNTAAGAFAITPKSTATTLTRTLWTDDPADHFVFTAATNVYYNFSVASTLADDPGDAVITVSNATAGVVYSGETEIARALLPVGTTYVIISHGTGEMADSAYALTFSRAAGGIVRFTNAKGTAAVSAYAATEGSAAATLYVQRTGTEGAMRVRYATQAGTALPGTNYYPVVTNEVSWTAGNKAVKAIKVNLIPDAIAHWEASNKVFSVRLYPVDAYDLESGEYLPIIPADTAIVTIKESSAKKPGTVSLVASYESGKDRDLDGIAVVNVKKPAVSGMAGQPQKLVFSRTGGTDGPVAIRVTSPSAAVAKKNKDTALVGTDFEAFDETLEWADGEDGEKEVEVNLQPSSNYAATKKFVFTIATVKTDGTLPTLSAKTATLTILNDTVAQTSAAYAKTIAAATGLKLSATGTWFTDYDGTFRSGAANGTLTYTLTGPGLFGCEAVVITNAETAAATLTCQIVNKTAKLNETVTEFTGRLVRVIPAGTTTVKFTLGGVKGDAYVKFTPQADGSPYVWGRFADVAPAAWSKAGLPALPNKAVVRKADISGLSFAWTLPAALAAEPGLYCRVRHGTTAKPTEVRWWDKDHTESAPPVDGIVLEPAGTTYYWALDYAYTDAASPSFADLQELPWTTGPSTWSYTTVKDGAPITSVGSTCEDAAGNSIADLVAAGEPVELIQCVQPDIDLDGDGEGDSALPANRFRLVAGALPKGLSLNASTGVITGVPTTPGTYTVLLQSYNQTGTTKTTKVNGKSKKVTTYTYAYGTTIPVTFNVLPAGTMIGSFRGTLQEANGELATDARRLGLLTLSVTSAGKITAKAAIGGIAYAFTGTAGFDELLDRDETAPGCTRHVQVTLQTTVKTVNSKKKVTGTYKENYLTLTLGDGALTNAVALAEAAGTAELTLNVLNAAKSAVVPDVQYTADLYRNNGGTDPGTAALTAFTGYYTAALAPEGVSAADGVPVGNGYLTFTVSANGAVKVAGSLADGTAVSFSTIGQPVGDTLADPKACTLMIPVYVGNATYAFGGDVKIAFPAGAEYAVVLPAAKLVWEKNAAKTTSYDGTAFAISLAPTGGWYDKINNLQNYYLGREFALSTIESGEDLPAAALASGYSFTTLSSPKDLEVSFTGNALTVPARTLVKNKTTGLVDFGTSVNPWNTTVKFTRATGILAGTFNAWEWVFKSDAAGYTYATAQKQIASLAHKGILLFTRDDSAESPLADNVLTAGYFLMPATTSTKASVKKAAWKASLPFNILTVDDGEKDWDEKEFDD